MTEKAKTLLASGDYTCVLCKGDAVYQSKERGVKPLLDWLESGTDLRGFAAADRVVGKAAAYLYVLLGVRAVYAPVMSEAARAVLERYGIEASCGVAVPAIRNRAGTGLCPVEQAVADIDTSQAALPAIVERLQQLQKS